MDSQVDIIFFIILDQYIFLLYITYCLLYICFIILFLVCFTIIKLSNIKKYTCAI